MELVVDANILLASFLKEAKTRELIFDTRLTLYAPEHLILETSKQLKKDSGLRKRIRLPDDILEELIRLLMQKIQVMPFQAYHSHLKQALTMASHPEDAPYIALALSLRIPVWSNDKGLKIQKTVAVFSTQELLSLLDKMSD